MMRSSPAAFVVVLVLSAAAALPLAARQAPEKARDGLIGIDVAVVEANGRPVVGLTPDQFDLTLDGQPQRVLSAKFVSSDSAAPGSLTSDRTFALALNLASFSPIESIGMIVAAQGFVDRIPPIDRIGVFTYPDGAATELSTDRETIRHALEVMAGLRPAPATAGQAPPSASPVEPAKEVSRTVDIDGLRTVLGHLGPLAGRKIIVLVMPDTGPANSVPDGRELGSLGVEVARSNAILYTLLVDTGFIDLTIPEKERPLRRATQSEETLAFERWLAALSGISGGRLFRVGGLDPEPVFKRVLSEVSNYYVLGVDAAGMSDGRPHELSVKVKQPGATVLARNWAVTSALPMVGPATLPADGTGTSSLSAPRESDAPRAAADRRSPAHSDPILSAFERGQYAAAQQGLLQTHDLAKWIRDFRGGKTPWPDEPRRASVLALEVTAVSLGTGEVAVREEVVKMLLQQAAALRPATASDNFECAWYWAALMLFEASDEPEASQPLVRRAIARCPDEPRIVLARAVLADLGSPVLVGIRVGAAVDREVAAHQAAIDGYLAAMKSPDTEAEARVRAAWLLCRLKRLDEALKLVEAMPASSTAPPETFRGLLDRQVRYLGHLVHGHVLRGLDRADDAARAYRSAIGEWPSAQAARISLMTLLATRGRVAEAAALASEVERLPDNATDPWWWFWQGDRQLYPVLIARLRGIVR